MSPEDHDEIIRISERIQGLHDRLVRVEQESRERASTYADQFASQKQVTAVVRILWVMGIAVISWITAGVLGLAAQFLRRLAE